MKKWYFFILLFSMNASYISAQVSVNSDGSEADASAMLDVVSTTKGMLVPRMTTTQRTNISNAANGLLVFDETTASFWFYKTSTGWEELSSGSSSVSEIDDLSDATTDATSVFLGSGSGAFDDGSNSNTSLGIDALENISSGIQNIAIGRGSLSANATGTNNVAIGSYSLINNTSSSNIAIGSASSNNNTSGSYNVSIGSQSLFNNETGNNNTIIGHQAGYGANGNSTSGNILIGYQAGYNETGSNKLYIENSNADYPLIGGDFSTNIVDINGRLDVTTYLNVGGAAIFSNSLTVSSYFKYNYGSPGSGKVLTSDANGYASWQSIGSTGAFSIDDLTDAASDGSSIFLGNSSGLNDDGSNGNIAIGLASMAYITSGQGNVAIGGDALKYNQGGSHNTAIGPGAGWGAYSDHNKSGGVFIGYQAGYNETSSNKLYIANSNTSTPLIGGDFSTPEVDINGDLNITGSLNITDGTQGNNKVLTSDASGNASWQNAGSPTNMTINDLTDGKTATHSVYLGSGSGTGLTSGYDNTAVGENSLNSTTTGVGNSSFGYLSSVQNTTGSYNTAYGVSSLFSNIAGAHNVAIGGLALYYNQSGHQNTALGYQAGRGSSGYNTNGCVYLGYQAGFSNITNNKLFIENSTSTNPLIGGDFDSDYVDIHGDLNLFGVLKISGGTPGNGKVLTSDASGNGTWQAAATPTIAINDLTDGKTYSNGVFLGTNSGSNISGAFNTAIGNNSMQLSTTAGYNIALGYESLADNTSGSYNTAIGIYSLNDNQTGSQNVALGYNAGATNSGNSKSGGIFIGYQAGFNETNDDMLYIENSGDSHPLIGGNFNLDTLAIAGDLGVYGTIKITGGTPGANKVLTSDADGNATWENTGTPSAMGIDDLTEGNVAGTSIFVGTNAGANDDGTNNLNTSFGNETLKTNISGTLNTAVGYGTLNVSTSSNNTAVGYKALYYNTSGTRNTANGTYALSRNTTGNDNLGFGYYASYTNQTGDNNVAIGKDALKLNTANNNTAIGYQAAESLTTYENTTTIGYNATALSSNSIVLGNGDIIGIGGYANWTNLSDKRFKNQIKENVAGLNFIMKLRPVTYHLDVHKLDQFLGVEEKNPDEKSKRAKETIQYTGFIAQEVEQAAQEVNYDFSGVGKPQNEKDYYSLAYAEFVVPLVKAVQEQQKQIETQQAMIDQMQAEIKKLKK